MKWDMGGAGAVAGALKVLATRKAKVNVIGVCGLGGTLPLLRLRALTPLSTGAPVDELIQPYSTPGLPRSPRSPYPAPMSVM